jgi:hypothetical protein
MKPLVHEATGCAIVEARGPPNMLYAPVEAQNEPPLPFLLSPGPENSPDGVTNNGLLPAFKEEYQPPTDQALQHFSTKNEAILAAGLPKHCARPASSNIWPHHHGTVIINKKLEVD